MTAADASVTLLDYGAGNVLSVVNALKHLGNAVKIAQTPQDITDASRLIFPGVGAFGNAINALESKNFMAPLRAYLDSGRPFMGICIGMQVLCQGSDESPGVPGLGLIPAAVKKFKPGKSVPHMGWNGVTTPQNGDVLVDGSASYYFVHSFALPLTNETAQYAASTTRYGNEVFVSAVRFGNVFATQFHPEKSGQAGLAVLRAFLTAPVTTLTTAPQMTFDDWERQTEDRLTKRIVACLDVRSNDDGDLIVTKGDQYDVREKPAGDARGTVRNLGKPVELARRYYQEGADEVTFLNITSFRSCPLNDLPMLNLLRETSETVFVPLTIGGGIRSFETPDGKRYSALDVADAYFRSGADKVSIGSDAVLAAESLIAGFKTKSAITEISEKYGAQAVVISVDPRRVHVHSPADTPHHTVKTAHMGPNGEAYCWYQCTIKGGREARDLDVVQLVQACERMGAGEILLNCMDKDGTNSGYDLDLVRMVKTAVTIPVIASSGAGCVEHFSEVFIETNVDAALAAGIFHRREVPIDAVKRHLQTSQLPVRLQ